MRPATASTSSSTVRSRQPRAAVRPGRGSLEYFGEIALLRDIPRTATITARTAVRLYALERDDFLAAVTGYSGAMEAGEAVVAERLAPA